MQYIRNQIKYMDTILDSYQANKDTCMVIPAKHMEYYSIAIERNDIYCIKQTPLDIIKHHCERDWTTFEGRKKIIVEKTGYTHKTPMLLNTNQLLFAFPTMAVKKFECSWLFLQLHYRIEKYGTKSAIIFHDTRRIILDISYHTLQSQYERTWALDYMVRNANLAYHPTTTKPVEY